MWSCMPTDNWIRAEDTDGKDILFMAVKPNPIQSVGSLKQPWGISFPGDGVMGGPSKWQNILPLLSH